MKKIGILLFTVCFSIFLTACGNNADEGMYAEYPYAATTSDYPDIMIVAKNKDSLDEVMDVLFQESIMVQTPELKDKETVSDRKIYKQGEFAHVETEYGNYKFGVVKAEILPKTTAREAVYKITWEYQNENFEPTKGSYLRISSFDLSVTDSDGYVVQEMGTGWAGDWGNTNVAVAPGKKCVAHHTFVINNAECEYLEVALPTRDVVFRVEVEEAEIEKEDNDSVETLSLSKDSTIEEQTLKGEWKAKYVISDGDIYDDALTTMLASATFYSDYTGELIISGEPYSIKWEHYKTNSNGYYYRIKLDSDSRNVIYITDSSSEGYELLTILLDDETGILFEKK